MFSKSVTLAQYDPDLAAAIAQKTNASKTTSS